MPPHHAREGRAIRCAIYARKSVKEGLDQEQNSLEVQRDICSSYIRSQRHRNWSELEVRYNDGGFSGGTMARPALQRLLADVERGFVDVVVIYKLDRLTRSMSDFIRLIDLFEEYGVTFVSVTQSFDTQDSMGRLVLNILLTFAQFEREMLADRVRDKMAAMKRAGRWTGGAPPYGYDVVEGKLLINPTEALVIQEIFERYAQIACSIAVTRIFEARGLRSKSWTNRRGEISGGGLATRGMIYGVLGSPLYVGEIHHNGTVYKGVHQPIISRELWDRVQAIRNSRKLKQPPARPYENLLLGLLFDDIGRRMRIDAGVKDGRMYRYYISDHNHRATRHGVKPLRARAVEMEEMVAHAVCAFLRRRFEVSGAIYSLGVHDPSTERLIANAGGMARQLETLDNRHLRPVWEQLLERIEVSHQTLRIILRCEILVALLGWTGRGLFRARSGDRTGPVRHHMIETDAHAVRSERTFRLAFGDRNASGLKPNKRLVELIALARQVQTEVFDRRKLTIEELARKLRRRPAFLSRVLCLNYLAPDIIAAILDGRQPPQLTRKRLIFSHIPMSWPEQRSLLGFAPQRDPTSTDVHY